MKFPLIIALGLTALASPAFSNVKMGHDNICYAPDDPLNARIQARGYFRTMTECENAKGVSSRADRAPRRADIHSSREAELATARNPDPMPVVAQSNPDDWITRSHSCRDAQQEVLAQSSTIEVSWGEGGCHVKHGVWNDALRGGVITDPNRVSFSHAVPMSWALSHGASNWTSEQRQAFYLDRDNILATDIAPHKLIEGHAPLNWMPYDPVLACVRVNAFITVANRHGLEFSPQEAKTVQDASQKMCNIAPHAKSGTLKELHAQTAENQRLQVGISRIQSLEEQSLYRMEMAPTPRAPQIQATDSTRYIPPSQAWPELSADAGANADPIEPEQTTLPAAPEPVALPRPPIAYPGAMMATRSAAPIAQVPTPSTPATQNAQASQATPETALPQAGIIGQDAIINSQIPSDLPSFDGGGAFMMGQALEGMSILVD